MKKGDICIVRFTDGEGREQEGVRPAVFLAETNTRIIIVAPLTSNLDAQKFPFTFLLEPDEINGLQSKSIVLLFHIRAIDKSRGGNVIGSMAKEEMDRMDGIVREMFKLK